MWLCSLLFLAACTTPQLQVPAPQSAHLDTAADTGLAYCARLFIDVESALALTGARDMQAQRIRAFPYLRVNRLLASLRPQLESAEQVSYWAGELRMLDRTARQYELPVLFSTPDAVPESLQGFTPETLQETLNDCAEQLLEADLQHADRVAALIDAAEAPDSYSMVARTAGIYPVSSWFVSQGVRRLQSSIHNSFANSNSTDSTGNIIRYLPPATEPLTAETVAGLLHQARSRSPLGIPALSEDEQDQLFRHFAPVWDIGTASEADIPGSPYWSSGSTVRVNLTNTVVYHKLSFTRLDGEILAQLNYVIWFPERPRESRFDLLGGHLDGITLRITLGRDGQPIMYDAMHNCGCYHMYFPPEHGLYPTAAASEVPEPLLIPTRVPAVDGGRLTVRTEPGSHYIIHVQELPPDALAEAPDSVTYRFRPYDTLRALPLHGSGQRSLFDEDGLVSGTTRLERWVLWPMGVIEPGAMRQWGHHATAFVGRRHFDDAFLLQQFFSSTPQ